MASMAQVTRGPKGFSPDAKRPRPAIAVNDAARQVKFRKDVQARIGQARRAAASLSVTAQYNPPVMTRFLLVASGGALGAVARYGLGLLATRLAPGAAWPWGTFGANVIGGFLAGMLFGWLMLKSGTTGEGLRLFAAVGVRGGFTTFSAFSLETADLLERREGVLAAAYVAASVLLAVGAVFAGLALSRRLFA